MRRIPTTQPPIDCQWMWDGFQWIPYAHEACQPPCWPPLNDGVYFGHMTTTGRTTTPPPRSAG